VEVEGVEDPVSATIGSVVGDNRSSSSSDLGRGEGSNCGVVEREVEPEAALVRGCHHDAGTVRITGGLELDGPDAEELASPSLGNAGGGFDLAFLAAASASTPKGTPNRPRLSRLDKNLSCSGVGPALGNEIAVRVTVCARGELMTMELMEVEDSAPATAS